MNVLFVSHYVEMYGANRSLVNLLHVFLERGARCSVLCPTHGPLVDTVRNLGVSVIIGDVGIWVEDVPMPSRKNLLLRARRIARIAFKFFRVAPKTLDAVRNKRPDLVYTNSSVCFAGFVLARKLGVPHVWHVREYGVEDYALRFVLGRLISVKVIRSSDLVVFVSEDLRNHFFGSRSFRNVHVVYNGVISLKALANYRVAGPSTSGPLKLLMVGVLHQNKGYDLVLRTLERINVNGMRVTLTIAGGGPAKCRDKPKEMGDPKMGDPRLTFLGFVNDPFTIYGDYDGLVVASRREAMGRVTAEAMLLGLPVLGADSGGTPELFQDGVHGYLYPRNEEGLEAAIERVLGDRGRWRRMGEVARSAALERFTEEVCGERVYSILLNELGMP